jgi:pimeloyl-ACP methyl ester carboxylesterase
MTEIDYALLDRLGAASAIFYPREDWKQGPEWSTDLMIPVEPGVRIAARIYAFDPELPSILYFHGNGEVASDYDELSRYYRASGANLLVADFRGYGRSDGVPTFARLVADAPVVAEAFHDILDEVGFDAPRFVMGRSLGSHPALEIAATAAAGFSGLIIESGAWNVRRMAERFGAGEEGAALGDAHEAKLRGIELRTLIIHGERDDLVPIGAAEALRDLLTCERELVVLRGAGHNDLTWLRGPEYFEAIGRFVLRG